jgi:uncharacterized membrane protein YfcA
MNTDRIDMRVVLGIALGGTPAVLIAVYAVTSMPLVYLRWVVVAVVLYAAVVLLRSALRPAAVFDLSRRAVASRLPFPASMSSQRTPTGSAQAIMLQPPFPLERGPRGGDISLTPFDDAVSGLSGWSHLAPSVRH